MMPQIEIQAEFIENAFLSLPVQDEKQPCVHFFRKSVHYSEKKDSFNYLN